MQVFRAKFIKKTPKKLTKNAVVQDFILCFCSVFCAKYFFEVTKKFFCSCFLQQKKFCVENFFSKNTAKFSKYF